jgi:hypothetical protein
VTFDDKKCPLSRHLWSPTLSFVRFQTTICGPCNVLKAQLLVVGNRVDEIVLKITFCYCKLSSIKVISQP